MGFTCYLFWCLKQIFFFPVHYYYFSLIFFAFPQAFTSSPNTIGPLWLVITDACILTIMAEHAAISFLAHQENCSSFVNKAFLPFNFSLMQYQLFKQNWPVELTYKKFFNTSQCKETKKTKQKRKQKTNQPAERKHEQTKKLFHKQKWCRRGGERREETSILFQKPI